MFAIRYWLTITNDVEALPVLITIKVLTTFLTVVLLATSARKLGPSWAGVLAGFPLGGAITLYFIGYEIGPEFAAKGATQALIGLLGCLMLAIMYLIVSQRWPSSKSIYRPITFSVIAFFVTAFFLQNWDGPWWLNLGVIFASILLAHHGLGRIEDHEVALNPENIWHRPIPSVLFRAATASASVLGITTLAHWLEPTQAGLLAAFPVSFFPVLIVLHLSYGAPVVATTIRQYPAGLGAMVVYILAVSFSYPIWGLNQGTAMALAASMLYLTIYVFFVKTIKQRLSGKPHETV